MQASRRGLFGWTIGGAAAFAGMGGAAGQVAPPSEYPMTTLKGIVPLDPGQELINAARAAFHKHAEEEKQRLHRQIEARINALQDLKSVSEAWRRQRSRELWDEHNNVQKRFWDLVNAY